MSTAGSDRDALVAAVIGASRRVGGQEALFGQAAAERLGLAPTDVACLTLLSQSGRLPAGRLAEVTGLTTGAATRMIDRLEQAGYVRRLPDPADRRRVLVDAVPERVAAVDALFAGLARATGEAIDAYADDDLRVIAAYLERTLEVARIETARLRQAPTDEEPASGSAFAAPLGPTTRGRLLFLSGVPTMAIRGDAGLTELYRARFQGPVPKVRSRGGTVTVRYARFAWFGWRTKIAGQMLDANIHWNADRGAIDLNASIPWAIELRGGGYLVSGDLRAVALESFEVAGGVKRLELTLPAPSAVVPIRVSGGANEIVLHRPAGVAARVRVAGGATSLSLDGQHARGGGPHELATPDAATSATRYEVEVAGGTNRLTVDAR